MAPATLPTGTAGSPAPGPYIMPPCASHWGAGPPVFPHTRHDSDREGKEPPPLKAARGLWAPRKQKVVPHPKPWPVALRVPPLTAMGSRRPRAGHLTPGCRPEMDKPSRASLCPPQPVPSPPCLHPAHRWGRGELKSSVSAPPGPLGCGASAKTGHGLSPAPLSRRQLTHSSLYEGVTGCT